LLLLLAAAMKEATAADLEPTPCERAAKHNQQLLARARAEGKAGTLRADSVARVERALRRLDLCLPMKHGAWALLFSDYSWEDETDQMQSKQGEALLLSWSLQYVNKHYMPPVLTSDRLRLAVRGVAEIGSQFQLGEDWPGSQPNIDTTYDLDIPDSIRLADYDSDGNPEVILRRRRERLSWDEDWSNDRRDSISIYSYRREGGEVHPLHLGVPLYPNIDFDDVQDVDKDGLPDLIYHPFVAGYFEGCGIGESLRVDGPSFLAHARSDGSFLFDDDVAQQYAKRACPSRPIQPLIGTIEETLDKQNRFFRLQTDKTMKSYACARLYGVPTAKLIKDAQQKCALGQDIPDGEITWCDACRRTGVKAVSAVASVVPPLRLH
jgi:hypothetical protein